MLLNVLKILGLALTTVSGVVAAVKETKTPDKKSLTGAGKTLLVLGILGFALALGAQLKEWQEKQASEEASRKQVERLLIEIRRAVTRLDTVSIDVSYPLLIQEPEFAKYRHRLDTIIGGVVSKSPGAGDTFSGLQVITRSADSISILSAPSGSSALPHQGDGDAAEFYARARQPHIAIYKKGISSKEFSSIDEGKGSQPADLVFIPGPEKRAF